MEETVRSGLVMAWRFATWPTMRSPVLENATTDGVVLLPSTLAITTASPPSITATQEFVVPKSIPITLLIIFLHIYLYNLIFCYSYHCWSYTLFINSITFLKHIDYSIISKFFAWFKSHSIMHVVVKR